MTYKDLHQRFLQIGNFHPESTLSLDQIVERIGRMETNARIMTGMARELAQFIDESQADTQRRSE